MVALWDSGQKLADGSGIFLIEVADMRYFVHQLVLGSWVAQFDGREQPVSVFISSYCAALGGLFQIISSSRGFQSIGIDV